VATSLLAVASVKFFLTNAPLAYGRLALSVFHEVTRLALVAGSASLMNGESSVRRLRKTDFNATSLFLRNSGLRGNSDEKAW
jgi:hypothetical protein